MYLWHFHLVWNFGFAKLEALVSTDHILDWLCDNVVVKLLACGANCLGFEPESRHYDFRVDISCFQVAIWLKHVKTIEIETTQPNPKVDVITLILKMKIFPSIWKCCMKTRDHRSPWESGHFRVILYTWSFEGALKKFKTRSIFQA